MPIPQENSLFVERASSPLLTLVQDVSWIGFLTAESAEGAEKRGMRNIDFVAHLINLLLSEHQN